MLGQVKLGKGMVRVGRVGLGKVILGTNFRNIHF